MYIILSLDFSNQILSKVIYSILIQFARKLQIHCDQLKRSSEQVKVQSD